MSALLPILFVVVIQKGPRQCDRTLVNWQESHLLSDCCWSTMCRGGSRTRHHFVGGEMREREKKTCLNWTKEDCRLDTNCIENWIVGVCNRMTQISPSSTSFMSCYWEIKWKKERKNVSGFSCDGGWTAVGSTFSSVRTVQISNGVLFCLHRKDGVIFFFFSPCAGLTGNSAGEGWCLNIWNGGGVYIYIIVSPARIDVPTETQSG